MATVTEMFESGCAARKCESGSVSKRNPASRKTESLDAVIIFNIADVLRNSRLGNMKFFCRAGETQFLADSKKSQNTMIKHGNLL